MRFVFLAALCTAVLARPASASTVFGVSTGGGTAYSVAISTFTATGNTMAGMTITTTFGDATTANCTWSNNVGGGNSGCTSAGNFSIIVGQTVDTDPAAASLATSFWTITDLRTNATGHNITQLGINGVAGLVNFDRCTVQGATAGSMVFLDSDAAPTTGGNANTCYNAGATGAGQPVEGTTGSNVGYSAHGGPGGTTSSSANAIYTDPLHLGNAAAVGDLWGTLTFQFGANTTPAFLGGQTFVFEADTDLLTSATAVTPEPGTFVLAGALLLGLGALRRRHS